MDTIWKRRINALLEKGMTQEDISTRTGVHKDLISLILSEHQITHIGQKDGEGIVSLCRDFDIEVMK